MAIDLSKYGEPMKSNAVGGIDLSKYGQAVEVAPEQKQEGFFKGVYKSLFSPVVNLIARPGQAVQALAGQEPSTGKFLGLDVTAPKTGKDVLKDVGRGIETVAMGIGVGGTPNIIKTGIKQGIKQGAKEGAVIGLKSSPLIGAGASLTSGETDIKQIIKDAAVSTAIGTPLSAGLGGLIPGVAGVGKKFTQQGVRDELGNIFRQTASKYVKPQAILDQAEQVSKTDPIAVLQMYGKNTIPEMKGGGADTQEAQAFLRSKIGELSNLRNEDLFLNDTRIPLQSYRQYANELLDAQNWSTAKKEAERVKLNKVIDNIENGYKDSPKNVDGIELPELNLIKSEQTALSKSYNNPSPGDFSYDTHSIAGKAARDLIELSTESETVKDLNKLIQSHYDAVDFLDAINGKKVHGGALSKAFLKLGGDVVGAVAGQAVGQPIVGAVTGHLISGKVADIIQNRFITNPIKRMLINNLKEQSPKEVQAVLKSLESKYKTIFDDLFPEGVSYKSPSKNNQLTGNQSTATAITNNNISLNNAVSGKQSQINLSTTAKESGKIDELIASRIAKNPEMFDSELASLQQSYEQMLGTDVIPKEVKLDTIQNLQNQLSEIEAYKSIAEETLKMNPAKDLMKYTNKRTGELPEVTGKGKSVFANKGDVISEGAGFNTSEEARAYIEKYNQSKDNLNSLKNNLKSLKGKISTIKEDLSTKYKNLPKQAGMIKVGNESDSLLQEARKYKSAEEFVKAQPTVYHGTKQQFDTFSSEKLGSNTKAKSAKEGFFFTDNIENANHYTKKVIDTANYDVAKKIMEDGRFRFQNSYSSRTIGVGKNISALDFGNKSLTKENILKVASDNFDNEISSIRKELNDYTSPSLKARELSKLDEIAKNKPSYMKIWEDNVKNVSTNAPEIKDVVLDYKKSFIVNASESNFGSGNLGGAKFTDATGKVHTGYADTIKYAKENGYDAVIMKNVKDPIKANNTIVFSPDQIKTKSQLTDIWKKAQGQGGFITINGKTFKEIPASTKKEIEDIIDYLRLGKETKNIEDTLLRITEKYNIKTEQPSSKIANQLEDLIRKTKTKSGMTAVNPLTVGAGVLGAGAGVANLKKK